jgi:hypothetical protein
LQAETSLIVGEQRGIIGIMLDDAYRTEHLVVRWLGVRSGLGKGRKPRDTAGIGKGLRGLFVEPTEALAFALGPETGLRVLCRHTASISFGKLRDCREDDRPAEGWTKLGLGKTLQRFMSGP